MKKIFLPLFLASMFLGACVNEKNDPPGCTTPDAPTIQAQRTEFSEGEDIVLDGIAPAGAEDGAFEWQGPNRYFITNQQLVIKNAKQVNEGEYKVFYLNKSRCRSQSASVFVVVNTFAESCGLRENVIRQGEKDIQMQNVKPGNESFGNFSVTAGSDTLQLKIIFPGKERPSADRKYNITQNSGGALGPNELDIVLTIGGQEYYAIADLNNTVNLMNREGKLHIAFCNYFFTNGSGINIPASGNIVVP